MQDEDLELKKKKPKKRKRGKKGMTDDGTPKDEAQQRKLQAMIDYDKLANVDDLASGYINVNAELEDPNLIREPEEWEVMEDPNVVHNLSYRKVKEYQYKRHPRDRIKKDKFHWWRVDLSRLYCCLDRNRRQHWVTPCAKEIGLGPTLFLMTQKAFTWLFAFLAIMNFPLFFFYSRGDGGREPGSAQSKQFTDIFGKLSLGNIGTSDYTCANFNLARADLTLRLNCPYGTMRELTEYGL